MRAETSARYRAATERKYDRTFTDEEWSDMVYRYERKKRARYAVAKNVQRGTILAYCCQHPGCGSKNAEAHHPDYRLPLAVIWYCRLHHAREHARVRRMGKLQAFDHNAMLIGIASKFIGAPASWLIQEALQGFPMPTEQEEEDWGSLEDFQDTIVEYDEEEVRRSQATSEDCLPEFVHTTYLPISESPSGLMAVHNGLTFESDGVISASHTTTYGLPDKAKVCPHCGGAI